jgi:quercetin 2,3-dioxygenase
MIKIRQANERGHFDHGWLDTYHTFSFGDYDDPAHRGFRALRVINEDVVQPGRGFGMHPHQDMEIVTLVLEGALTHKDSLGHAGVIRAGDLQRMTAGTGIWHSEANSSASEPVHLYQIWLFPETNGLEPSYEQKQVIDPKHHDTKRLVASHDGREGSLRIQQDADLYLASLAHDEPVIHELPPGRHAWLQVLRGEADLNGHRLRAGDGAAATDEHVLHLRADRPAEVLLFDLN